MLARWVEAGAEDFAGVAWLAVSLAYLGLHDHDSRLPLSSMTCACSPALPYTYSSRPRISHVLPSDAALALYRRDTRVDMSTYPLYESAAARSIDSCQRAAIEVRVGLLSLHKLRNAERRGRRTLFARHRGLGGSCRYWNEVGGVNDGVKLAVVAGEMFAEAL